MDHLNQPIKRIENNHSQITKHDLTSQTKPNHTWGVYPLPAIPLPRQA